MTGTGRTTEVSSGNRAYMGLESRLEAESDVRRSISVLQQQRQMQMQMQRPSGWNCFRGIIREEGM
jgi:hypothetical protein